MSLQRVLYRQLLRLARTHDRHPCLKGWLEHPRLRWKMEQLAARHARATPEGHATTTTIAGGVPLRVVRPAPGSGQGGGLILSGSLSDLTGRSGGPQALAKLVARIVAQELEEGQGRKGEEGDDEDDDMLLLPSLHEKSEAQLAKEDDAGWSSTVSPALARWMAAAFRGADHYVPQALFTDIVKREFRLPIEEATGASAASTAAAAAAAAAASPAKPASAASSKAKKSASSKAPAPVDPLTQLTTDAFGVLRTLNKSASDGAAKKLLFSEDFVKPDPAFQPPEDAPLPPEDVDAEQLRMRPLPRSALRTGVFLLAHPEMDQHGGVFSRSIILLYRHSAREGAAGVVLNRPFRTSPCTLGERLKRMRLADPMRVLKPCALHDGGPVMGEHGGGSVTASTAHLAGLRFLHRHPALAPYSDPVIDGGPLPVWHLPFARLSEAVEAMAKAQSVAEATAALEAAQAAGYGAPASSPPAPAGSFLPSDLIAYSGYAEWYPGQLESELRRGSWLLAEGNAAHVFTGETGAKDIDAAFAAAKRRKNNAKAAASMAAANGDDSSASSSAAPSSTSSVAASDSAAFPSSSDATASSSSSSSSAALVPTLPVRLARPFNLDRLWAHGMHASGGECRHWAHWPPPGSDAATPEDKQAMLTELLRGRE